MTGVKPVAEELPPVRPRTPHSHLQAVDVVLEITSQLSHEFCLRVTHAPEHPRKKQ